MINITHKQVQHFLFFIFMMLTSVIYVQSTQDFCFVFNKTEGLFYESEDELLLTNIMEESAKLYKVLIDLFALYVSGLIIDNDQLLERIFVEVCKECFQVIKLLAHYGPRMLLNSRLSFAAKAKKMSYIMSFVVVCWGVVSYERSCFAARRRSIALDNHHVD